LPEHVAMFGDAISVDHKDSFHLVSRFVVAPEARNMHIAASLAKAVYAFGRLAGVKMSYLHCAPRLILLWTRYGYAAFRPPFFDAVVGCQLPMRLTVEDESRLAEVKSPFCVLAQASRLGGAAWTRQWSVLFEDPRLAWRTAQSYLATSGLSTDEPAIIRLSEGRQTGH
jgi:hypothetical protein